MTILSIVFLIFSLFIVFAFSSGLNDLRQRMERVEKAQGGTAIIPDGLVVGNVRYQVRSHEKRPDGTMLLILEPKPASYDAERHARMY